MEIPTETCTHDNKNVNLQHYFFRIKVFKVIDEVGDHSVLGLIGILVVVAN